MEKQPKTIGEILIENGVLTKDQLIAALKIQKKEGGLIGEILIRDGFVNKDDIINALIKQCDYLYFPKERPVELLKKKFWIIVTSLFLTFFSLLFFEYIPFAKAIDRKLYRALLKTEYYLVQPPAAINDILLVTIDDKTLSAMPYRWPYPRSDFIKVIENLRMNRPRVIALDFAFFGKSNAADDASLINTLNFENEIILPSIINEQGELDFSNMLSANVTNSGIITKIQDSDGAIRRCLTYLVSADKDKASQGFLPWEIQILRRIKNIDLKSFSSTDSTFRFKNSLGEEWIVPVEADTKSFLIHFRAYTRDFPRISFYQVLKGNFDANLVKNKIVMVGTFSPILQDLEYTAIGWLPGLTVNANAFLTLYTHNFLKNAPKYAEYAISLLGIIFGAFFITWLSPFRTKILIFSEILLFFLLSFILLLYGYIWNYAVFPLAVALFPILSKKFIYFLRK